MILSEMLLDSPVSLILYIVESNFNFKNIIVLIYSFDIILNGAKLNHLTIFQDKTIEQKITCKILSVVHKSCPCKTVHTTCVYLEKCDGQLRSRICISL